MLKQSQVLLFGDSLLMDSVAESLLRQKSANVIRVRSSIQEARQFLKDINPDLVVYELYEKGLSPIFPISDKKSDTMHLAIDLNSKQIILANYQCEPTGSMQELCELISQKVSLKNIKKGVD